MRVLITGSSGKVGHAIADKLNQSRHQTVGLDLIPGPRTDVIGNICDPDVVRSCTSSVDAIIHTAALHAPHVGQHSDSLFTEVNVSATQYLLQAALDTQLQSFVYTSTTSIYGDALVGKNRAVWVDETLQIQPRDIYDQTKMAAEQACHQASQKGLACRILRISRCFPEAEHLNAIYRLYRGVDLRDVAQAHLLALEQCSRQCKVYNISAKPPFKKSDCKNLFSDPLGVINQYFPWAAQAFIDRKWPLPEKIDRVYAIDKALAELNYQPKFNFETLFQHSPALDKHN